MPNMRWFRFTSLIVILSMLAACQQVSPARKAPLGKILPSAAAPACDIKIGVINNSAVPQGQELQRGYKMAVDEINADGGVAGCRLVLVQAEDQNDPQKAEAASRKLIDEDQVSLLVGSFSSPCTLAAAAQAEVSRVPLLVPNSTSSLITQKGYRYTFRLPAESASILSTAFSWLQSESAPDATPTLSILYESNLTGSSMASAFTGMAAERGWSVLNYLRFNASLPAAEEEQHLGELLERVRNTLPDILFITGDSPESISLILKLIQQKKIDPKAIVGLGGAFSNADFFEKNPLTAEQILVVNQWAPEVSWTQGGEGVQAQFLNDFKLLYKTEAGNRSVQAYTTIYIAKTALETAYRNHPAKVKENLLQALIDYKQSESLFGPIEFNANGQNRHDLLLTQVVGGKRYVVFPASMQTRHAEYPLNRQVEAIASPASTGGYKAASSVLRIGFQEKILQFNPLWSSLNIERSFFRQVYDTLYEIGSSGKYLPLLAQETIRSDDGKTFRITLPDKVRFHDGMPLTAEDVVFSYRLYASTKDSVRANDLRGLESITAENGTTVLMTFTEPVSDIADKLSQLYILPKHVWEPIAADPVLLKTFPNVPLIGSGAFIYERQTPGVSVEMKANKAHWKRPPKVDAMDWQFYTDQDEMIDDLQYGDIDAASSIPPSAVNRIKNLPGIQVVTGTPLRPNILDIFFNLIDARNCPAGGKCDGHPALKDLQVRKALVRATDREKIIRLAASGMASPGTSVVPGSLEKWPNTTLVNEPYDLKQANLILDTSGYLDVNDDCIREMPDGKTPLVFRFYYPAGYPKYLYERPAEILNESWSALGIRLLIRAIPENELVEIVNPNFAHDIVLWEWNVNPNPNFILSVATTAQIPGGNSETGYANPQYDIFYDLLDSEGDQFKRVNAVWNMQEILFKDVVYIVPYEMQNTCAVRTDRFRGWYLNSKKLMLEIPDALSELEAVR